MTPERKNEDAEDYVELQWDLFDITGNRNSSYESILKRAVTL